MYPCLHVDLHKLRHNAEVLAALCRDFGMQLMAVTKGIGGAPEAAHAFLAGGAASLADSRLQNLLHLRKSGVQGEFWLLRSPGPSDVEQCAAIADGSFHSQWSVLQQLSQAAQRLERQHKVYIMVEMGDLREGLPPPEAADLFRRARQLPNLEVLGLGTNLACFAGIKPTAATMEVLADLAVDIARDEGCEPLQISAGNSSAAVLMNNGGWQGVWTGAMHHVRMGESLLFGWDIFEQKPLAGCALHPCVLGAEVIEVAIKGSRPLGPRGRDAFGQRPDFEDRGQRRRALVAVGRQDFGAGNLVPLLDGIEVIGATSDHLVLDVEAQPQVKVGTILEFSLDYGSLLALSTSNYVKKVFSNQGTL